MIGQERLQEVFNNFTAETLPNAMMVEGEYGCGKHTLVNGLATKVCLDIENISDKLSYEKITELYLRSNPYLYLVDKQLTEAEQNSLLKFIEEPPIGSHIVLICENREQFIPTVVGRCIVYKFDPYTDIELFNFSIDVNLIRVVRTPGKIKELADKDNGWVFSLNKTILTKIQDASIPNTLTIVDKFGYVADDDKLNVDIELSVLMSQCIDMFRETEDNKYLSAYSFMSEYVKKFRVPNVDKKKLFSLFLLDLKSCMKSK